VVFAQANEIHADGIGQNALIHHITKNLIMGFKLAVHAKRDIAERVDTKGKERCHGMAFLMR
jgi:hypothetical protein